MQYTCTKTSTVIQEIFVVKKFLCAHIITKIKHTKYFLLQTFKHILKFEESSKSLVEYEHTNNIWLNELFSVSKLSKPYTYADLLLLPTVWSLTNEQLA